MREDVDFLKRGAHTKLSSRKRQGGGGVEGEGASTSSFSEREGAVALLKRRFSFMTRRGQQVLD